MRSSGYWQDAGLIPVQAPAAGIGPAGRMAVVSGSVSPVTAAQIDWSLAHGFEGIAFDAPGCDGRRALAAAEAATVAAALACDRTWPRSARLSPRAGRTIPPCRRFGAALAAAGLAAEEANRGSALRSGGCSTRWSGGRGLRRAVISGGDTSGHASRQLGIQALTALAPTIPGAAIFRAHGEGAHDGLELALKGGQMGSPDYFGWVRDGGGARQGISLRVNG